MVKEKYIIIHFVHTAQNSIYKKYIEKCSGKSLKSYILDSYQWLLLGSQEG